jgi:choline dehydrogenase-like flavoprotein
VLSLRPVRGGSRGHVALSNLTILAVPEDDSERALQVSIYPMFDHLLRYYLPSKFWGAARRLARIIGAHVLIGRVYLGAAGDRTYRLTIVDDELAITPDEHPDPGPALRAFIRSLRGELKGTGFRVPPPTTIQATSSHYGCTLPYGDAERGVATDGTVVPGVHVADAAAFPTMPALSPTFTIMANAHRTVADSLTGREGESV